MRLNCASFCVKKAQFKKDGTVPKLGFTILQKPFLKHPIKLLTERAN
jgi:hypothetical protein